MNKFYYKLAVLVRGKYFAFIDKTVELDIGHTIEQDLEKPRPSLFVYKTPEDAVNNEL